MNLLPNLIVVGAAKSGTTTLFDELKQDPNIFIPEIKECRFFSQMPTNFKGGEASKFQNEGPRDIESYLKLFKNGEGKYLIDISNDYFYYYKKSIKNIKKIYKEFNLPQPKILIILRNPVKRVFSMYHHTIRLKSDTLDFKAAFAKSNSRIKNNYAWMFDLKGVGLSYDGTKEYLENFKDVKILLHDQFKKNEVLKSVYDFIDLEKPNKNQFFISNQNDYIMPRNLTINLIISKIKILFLKLNIITDKKNSVSYKFLKKLYIYINNLNKEKTVSVLEKAQKDMLCDFYKDDIKKLSNLIKVDLEHWISS